VPGTDNTFHDVIALNRPAFGLRTGLRAAVFVTAPLLLGLAIGQVDIMVFATLGALFITNTEGPSATALGALMLLVASVVEAASFAVGTVAGLTGLLAVLLLGVGVFAALILAIKPRWTQLGIFSAIFFAVGVGLPGGSVLVAEERLLFSLAGGLWATFGAWLHRDLFSRSASKTRVPPSVPVDSPSWRSEVLWHAIAVAVASAVGLEVGIALGLPRDFWIIVTIILAVRPPIGSTLSLTLMIVIGTVIGAFIAAAITLEIGDLYALAALLFVFAVGMFATRGVNLALVQLFLTPFLIILLNILFPGQWRLAEFRVIDVAIGGAIAVVTAHILRVRAWRVHGM
jgi:hypothetical protein